MACKPVVVELEAICKSQIKKVQQKIEELKRLESESAESDEVNIESYIRQRELRSYITQYRTTLDQIRRYKKG